MKKKILFSIAFALVVIGMPKAYAIHVDGGDKDTIGYEGSNVTVEKISEEEKSYKLTLTGNAAQDLEIQAGEKVVLDLAGHEFTNYTNSLAAIWILGDGELTIMDSSNGAGKIYRKSGSSINMPVVDNTSQTGKLTIQGGLIQATIKGEDAIHNAGTLVISGGKIETTIDGAWGVLNSGKATISGGEFVQGKDFSVVYNEGEMTISGGEFTASGDGHNSLISNKSKGEDSNATLTIENGKFINEGEVGIFYNQGEDVIEISGGTYSKDVKQYLAEGLEQDEDGNIFEPKKEDEKTPDEEKSDSEIETPETLDNILLYLVLGFVSVIGLLVSAYAFKRKLEN